MHNPFHYESTKVPYYPKTNRWSQSILGELFDIVVIICDMPSKPVPLFPTWRYYGQSDIPIPSFLFAYYLPFLLFLSLYITEKKICFKPDISTAHSDDNMHLYTLYKDKNYYPESPVSLPHLLQSPSDPQTLKIS